LLLVSSSSEAAWTQQQFSRQPSLVAHSLSLRQRWQFHEPTRTRAHESAKANHKKQKGILSATNGSTDIVERPSLVRQQLVLFDSKTRTKQPFTTLTPNHVKMYTCGPTVYDFAHIGNFRAFLTYDVLKRVLLYLGYSVDHVCNLTDVDDKIIQRANQEQVAHVSELTRRFEVLFFEDLKALNILPANVYPRATEHIDDMVDMIQALHQKRLAYQSSDGSWYFSVQDQPGYGQQLTNLNWDDMEATQRTASEDDVQKRSPFDFCLWKAYKPNVDRDDAIWDTPIGKGRPGWHLECSAMARRYLGDTLDVHCGGQDLKFPHHENEIAQSQGASGQVFCNCWIHNGFVNIGGDKMSKSLGNFLTLRTACPTALDVRAYRYLVVTSQYRNPLSFTPTAMQAAKNALKRVDKVWSDISEALSSAKLEDATVNSVLVTQIVPEQVANFQAALLDDLSMPRAAASLFALVKAAEQELKQTARDVVGLRAIRVAMQEMDRVFGIFYQLPSHYHGDSDVEEDGGVPSQVLNLVSQRNAAKEAKDWELADSLRARITELGFAVKDVKGGQPVVTRIES
jgi:cysteinyl-tRNA synthetase